MPNAVADRQHLKRRAVYFHPKFIDGFRAAVELSLFDLSRSAILKQLYRALLVQRDR
jgi:hypothetical protein